MATNRTITKKESAKHNAPAIVAKATGYASVRDRDKGRDAPVVETKNEDELLKGIRRLLLIASNRDNYRNTTISPATALQYENNIVGTVGGTLTVMRDGKQFDDATAAFHAWAKHAEFTRGLHINDLLCQMLVALSHTNGDLIAVIDDGILTHADDPSLRIKIFEADQIKNAPPEDFEKIYDKAKYTQVDGIVKDNLGRIVGAFVGQSVKGTTFAQGSYISLPRLERAGDFTRSSWIHIGRFTRPSQVRGVSQLSTVTNTITDLGTLKDTELSSAKLNAAFGLMITDRDADRVEEYAGREYVSALEDAENASGQSAIDDLTTGGDDATPEDIALAHAQNVRTAADRLLEGQSAILTAQPGKEIKSFDTSRPNLNVVQFYDRLKEEAGTVLGLPPMYTTLKPQGSYSAARAEMVLARPTFRKWQKFLERGFLDWLAERVLTLMGFDTRTLGYLWAWPEFEEVDEGSMQSAIQKKFANGEINLIDIHGANVDRFIEQRRIESEKLHAAGLAAPWDVTAAGAQIDNSALESDNAKKDQTDERS